MGVGSRSLTLRKEVGWVFSVRLKEEEIPAIAQRLVRPIPFLLTEIGS